MTFYVLTGKIFQSLIVIIPLYIILSAGDMRYKSLLFCLCLGCTFSYNYRLWGAISLLHILLVFIVAGTRSKHLLSAENRGGLTKVVFFYLLYVSVITIVFYWIKKDYLLRGSIVQNQLRPLVQIVFMATAYLAVIASSWISPEKSKRILKSVYKMCLFLAVLGIIQSLVYQMTGFDFFPIRRDISSFTYGLPVIGGNGFLRATGGVGEPKQLAKFLIVGLAFQLLCHRFLGYPKLKWTHIVLFLAALFFTYSTTGAIMFIFLAAFWAMKRAKDKPKMLGVFFVVMVILILLSSSIPVIHEKIEMAEQWDQIIGLEDTDTTAVRWLINNPQYAITGVGLANTVAYANKYTRLLYSFINFHPFTLRRGLVFQIAETGIIGLVLQLKIFKKLYRTCKQNPDLSSMFMFICFMYFFLTIEALLQFELLILVLLSNCGQEMDEETNNEKQIGIHARECYQ